YKFYTIDVDNYVWKDVVKSETLTVSKDALHGGDLGLYATEQLKQLVSHEIDRLHEAQASAQKNISQETIATSYGGLVGKILDDTTDTLPGYTPVVTPPPAPETASASDQSGSPSQTASAAAPVVVSAGAPTIVVQGNNPATINVHDSYSDLGATITG